MKKQSLKIKLTFSGALMLLALFLTRSYLSLAAILAAAIHELGHIIAARICKISLGELKLGIFGAALTPKTMLCSYKKEIALCLAGPLVNLLSAILLYPLLKSNNGFGSLFIGASLFLGILNLLPIHEFDGGRILFCILSSRLSLKSATRAIKITSFILIFSLWSLSVYLLLKLSSSVSLFIFSLSLFAKIFLSQRDIFY